MCSKPIYHGPRVKDLETFIQKAQFVHGEKYSYEKAEYVNAHTKLIITCPKHGDFEQRASHHVNHHGCSDCYYDSNRSDTEQFIQKANVVHDSKYSYEKAEYINNGSKITINCPIHGDFQQSPSSHLKGHGCAKCYHESMNFNNEKFIENARVVHGNTYDYSKVNYINNYTKITITCPKHGDFEQIPNNHINGNGCIECRNETHQGGYSTNKEEYKDKDAIFYHIRFTDKKTGDSFEKIGITVNSVNQRFYQITKDHNLKLEVINEYHTTLYEAIELEQEIKQHLLENDLAYRVQTLKQHKIGGYTECFESGVLDTELLMSK